MRNVQKILAGKPRGKRRLRRHRKRWEEDIMMAPRSLSQAYSYMVIEEPLFVVMVYINAYE
jgi:hypothetical protein